jgi:hypothetical protein
MSVELVFPIIKFDNYSLILKNDELKYKIKNIENKIINLETRIKVKSNKKQSLTLELEILNFKSRLEKEEKEKQTLEQEQILITNHYNNRIQENINNVNNEDFKEFINKYDFEPDKKFKVKLKQLYDHFKQYDKNNTHYKEFKSMMNDLTLFETNQGRTDRATFYGIKLK